MKVRLDELIRKGAEKTDKTKHVLINKQNQTCAYGAGIFEALNMTGREIPQIQTSIFHDNVKDIFSSVNNIEIEQGHLPNQAEVTFTKDHIGIGIDAAIMHLNDQIEMSREAIAEWVGYLIDEEEYDLYVDIPESQEEEQEKITDETKELALA